MTNDPKREHSTVSNQFKTLNHKPKTDSRQLKNTTTQIPLHSIKKSINFTNVSMAESEKHYKIFNLARRLFM